MSATRIIRSHKCNGGGKSYSDLLYDQVRRRGVYTYWRWYCSRNGYYYIRRFGETSYSEEDLFS